MSNLEEILLLSVQICVFFFLMEFLCSEFCVARPRFVELQFFFLVVCFECFVVRISGRNCIKCVSFDLVFQILISVVLEWGLGSIYAVVWG